MYPIFRTIYHTLKARRQPHFIHPFEESVIDMRTSIWDIDLFMEMNNGRYLTLMDIGRTVVGVRVDLYTVLRKHGWGLMVGAVSSRYRHRIRPFKKFQMHTQLKYVDDRWFYFHQWFTGKGGKKHASFLVRTAVTSKKGLVRTAEVIEAMGVAADMMEKYNLRDEWIEQWEKSDELHRVVMEAE